jgi:hypothetical protein
MGGKRLTGSEKERRRRLRLGYEGGERESPPLEAEDFELMMNEYLESKAEEKSKKAKKEKKAKKDKKKKKQKKEKKHKKKDTSSSSTGSESESSSSDSQVEHRSMSRLMRRTRRFGDAMKKVYEKYQAEHRAKKEEVEKGNVTSKGKQNYTKEEWQEWERKQKEKQSHKYEKHSQEPSDSQVIGAGSSASRMKKCFTCQQYQFTPGKGCANCRAVQEARTQELSAAVSLFKESQSNLKAQEETSIALQENLAKALAQLQGAPWRVNPLAAPAAPATPVVLPAPGTPVAPAPVAPPVVPAAPVPGDDGENPIVGLPVPEPGAM